MVISVKNKIKTIRIMYITIYSIFLSLYAIALFTIAFGEELYPDFETAYYWFLELIKTANLVMNIGLFAFLFISLIDFENNKSVE